MDTEELLEKELEKYLKQRTKKELISCVSKWAYMLRDSEDVRINFNFEMITTEEDEPPIKKITCRHSGESYI